MTNNYKLPKLGGLVSDTIPHDIVCRYEKIPTKIYSSETSAVKYVADSIEQALEAFDKENSTLNTFDTPPLFATS